MEFQPFGGAFAPGLTVAVGRFDADREVIDRLTGRVLESYFTFDPSSRTGFGVG